MMAELGSRLARQKTRSNVEDVATSDYSTPAMILQKPPHSPLATSAGRQEATAQISSAAVAQEDAKTVFVERAKDSAVAPLVRSTGALFPRSTGSSTGLQESPVGVTGAPLTMKSVMAELASAVKVRDEDRSKSPSQPLPLQRSPAPLLPLSGAQQRGKGHEDLDDDATAADGKNKAANTTDVIVDVTTLAQISHDPVSSHPSPRPQQNSPSTEVTPQQAMKEHDPHEEKREGPELLAPSPFGAIGPVSMKDLRAELAARTQAS